MRSFWLAATFLVAAIPLAQAQVKISQLPNLSAAAAGLTDALAVESASCSGGDCRETVQQVLNAALTAANTWTAAQTVINSSAGGFTGDYAQLAGQIGRTTGGVIYADACGGCTNADAVRGVVTAISGSKVTNSNGIAAYVLNQNGTTPQANGGNSVGLFSIIEAGASSTNNWGINTNVEDSDATGQDKYQNSALYNEFDFNVTDPTTTVIGLVIQGASKTKPSISAAMLVSNLDIGYQINGASGGPDIPWSSAFTTSDDAAVYGVQLGLAGGVCVNGSCPAGLNSQYIGLASTNVSGTKSFAYFYNTPNGLAFSSNIVPTNDASASFGGPSLNWLDMWSDGIVLKPRTVAALHACSYTYLGELSFVTDSQSTQIETNLQGGGVYHVVTFCDGSEWVVL